MIATSPQVILDHTLRTTALDPCYLKEWSTDQYLMFGGIRTFCKIPGALATMFTEILKLSRRTGLVSEARAGIIFQR